MSSSSSSISTTTVNGVTRVTGLASGIDVDSIVDQLMTAEKAKKLDKLEQKEQKTEWTQDAYRSVISDIQDFADTYLDLTSSGNILSKSTFEEFSVESSSTAVTASYTTDAVVGTHTVSVSQLATASKLTTTGTLSPDITGTTAADYSSTAGSSFVITLDDTDYTVTLDEDASTIDDLQSAIDSAVGSGKVSVTEDSSGMITIAPEDDSGVNEISVSSTSTDTTDKVLGYLGLTDGQSNRLSTSSTLSSLASSLGFSFDSSGQINLKINGVNFTFDETEDTLYSMMKEINASDAGVTMAYDELNDKLTLAANQTGAGTTLTTSETGSTFLSTCLGTSTSGVDCEITIDGQSLTRSSNTVTVDGVTYTANDETTSNATVSLTQDTDAIYDNIVNFVNAYNTLIDTINGVVDENYDDDYAPLTDEQKSSMTDDEITNWETKAKVGLLESDDTLQAFIDDIREALSSSVSGVSDTLASIGITTGDYDEKGKLYIDEDTLKEAIQDEPTEVMNLFAQTATTTGCTGTTTVRTMTSSERTTRTSEEGIAYKIYDIFSDNISTLRDSAGNKGLLIAKAGVENDTSETANALTSEIETLADAIDDEEDRLDDYEDSLYDKYDYLETYISTMNSQLSALSSMSSSSS